MKMYFSLTGVLGSNVVRYALFIVAGIQFLTGIVAWSVRLVDQEVTIPGLQWVLYNCQCGRFAWRDWVFVLSGVVYGVLGMVARRAPATCAVLGASLYAGLLGLQASESLDLLTTGLATKIIVAYLLLVATVMAFRRPRKFNRGESKAGNGNLLVAE
jgi:hypothetical protein